MLHSKYIFSVRASVTVDQVLFFKAHSFADANAHSHFFLCLAMSSGKMFWLEWLESDFAVRGDRPYQSEVLLIYIFFLARNFIVLKQKHDQERKESVIHFRSDHRPRTRNDPKMTNLVVIFREEEIRYQFKLNGNEKRYILSTNPGFVDFIYTILFSGHFAAAWQRKVVENLQYKRSLYCFAATAFPFVDQESFLRRLTTCHRLNFRGDHWKEMPNYLKRTGSQEREFFFQTMRTAMGYDGNDMCQICDAKELLTSARFLFTQDFGLSSDVSYLTNFYDIPLLLFLECLNRRLFEEVFDHVWIACLEDYYFIIHHPRPEYAIGRFFTAQKHKVQIVIRRELHCLNNDLKGRGLLQGDSYFHSGRKVGVFDDQWNYLEGEFTMAKNHLEQMAGVIVGGGWKTVFPPLGKYPPVKSLKRLAQFAVLKRVVLLKTYWMAKTSVLTPKVPNCGMDWDPDDRIEWNPYAFESAQLMARVNSLFEKDRDFLSWLSHTLEKYHFLLLCVTLRNHDDINCQPFWRYYMGGGLLTNGQISMIEDLTNLLSD